MWKNKIIEKLGQGGFDITYLAENTLLEGKVVIKEFFFKDYCERDDATSRVTVPTSSNRETVLRFKQKFIKEAKIIFKQNLPNIVRILDLFEENGTAYYVMEYIEGESNPKEAEENSAKTFQIGSVAFDMIWVEGGTFLMGATSEQGNDVGDDEKPVHSVTLSGYYIGKTEVTQALWKAVMGSNPSHFKGDNLPVDCVSWDDCQVFIRKLNALTGQNFRLPTEAEWEFACRGGNNSRGYKYSGSNDIDSVAWYDNNSGQKAHPVATKLPNELGIYDMSGNVWEWCSDWYGGYSSSVQTNPKCSDSGWSSRVCRGCDWSSFAGYYCRSSVRGGASPDYRLNGLGLRLALTPSSAATSVRQKDAPGYEVVFNCNVSSALLFIDGMPNGTASGTRFLKTGNHSIKVTADNYVDYSGSFVVHSLSRGVTITLQEIQEGHDVIYNPKLKTFNVRGVSFDMVEVLGGTFQMGATSEQGNDIGYDEKPVHSVTLSGYYIGKTEVTQALWKAVMGSNPSSFKGDNRPVENVSWNDCQKFIRILNSMTGQNFRLPTEAEWEFACRGGINSRGYKYSGSNYIDSVAWYDDNSEQKTRPVATKLPNELGIYDMSGNVWEWCSDWYGGYSSSAQTNPKGPDNGSYRVNRGGCWYYYAGSCRSSCRSSYSPSYGYFNLGLRLALTPSLDATSVRQEDAAGYDVLFNCNVPSALLFIDGVPNGTASGTRFLKTGNHSIKVTADKYEDYSGSFVVNSLSRGVNIALQKAHSAMYKPKLKTFNVKGVSFEMVEVRGGTFRMGATSEQGSDAWDEKPVHSVTLSGYYIGKTEVTQALWKAVMGSNPSIFKGDNRPVERVSWDDCQEFIRKLNSLIGLDFRLPTEAEWEFACRGGINSCGYKYSGSNTIDNVAWCKCGETHPVATKLPNELGIYDMSGNVWEWCNDRKGDYSSDAQTNPKGPNGGPYRVYRGGSWDDFAENCRSSTRNDNSPDDRDCDVGLRLCLTLSSNVTSVRLEETAGYDVVFDCNVPSALLFIDGVPNGTASGTRFLKTGNHSIKVAADNYVDYTGTFAVNSSSRSVSVNLQEVPVRFSDGVLTIKGVSYEMVWVEGGTFCMGATSEQGSDAFNHEKPVHSVTLNSYYIGKTEVTQALWKAVMGSNPSDFKGDNLPVEYVSWNDCHEFIRKLNALTGQNFRLPTEAEWEFACRGGNNSRGYKYSGSNYIYNVAWYGDNSGNKTHPVATKSPNELGIYDMNGNVWEWCSDWYGGYTSGAQTNPKGPDSGSGRVGRGGSWGGSARGCRSSFRVSFIPSFRFNNLGLRLAL